MLVLMVTVFAWGCAVGPVQICVWNKAACVKLPKGIYVEGYVLKRALPTVLEMGPFQEDKADSKTPG